MKQSVLYIIFLLTISCQLSAGVKALDWIALEEEACILEQCITDSDTELLPDKDLENKDPETKMPEYGIFHSNCRNTTSKFPDENALSPFVTAINCFSGFTNLANAP